LALEATLLTRIGWLGAEFAVIAEFGIYDEENMDKK
jgi:hypothetical protein